MYRAEGPRYGKIDRWGLLRGVVILLSALLAVTALHYLVLALFRG